jgi:hypothetical protein
MDTMGMHLFQNISRLEYDLSEIKLCKSTAADELKQMQHKERAAHEERGALLEANKLLRTQVHPVSLSSSLPLPLLSHSSAFARSEHDQQG